MPQLDISTFLPQVVWLVITFVTLFLIMWKVAGPRVANTLETRQRRISGNLDKAAGFKKEAEAVLEAYEQAMNEARAEAGQVIAKAGAELSEKVSRREAELAKRLAADIAESETRIEKAVSDAINDIGQVAVEAAGQVVRKLTGEDADEGAVGAAVDQAMRTRP